MKSTKFWPTYEINKVVPHLWSLQTGANGWKLVCPRPAPRFWCLPALAGWIANKRKGLNGLCHEVEIIKVSVSVMSNLILMKLNYVHTKAKMFHHSIKGQIKILNPSARVNQMMPNSLIFFKHRSCETLLFELILGTFWWNTVHI